MNAPIDTSRAISRTLVTPDQRDPYHKHLTAHSTWRGRARTDITIRHFAVATGEPERAGGDDSAPTPMELILAGLEGCLTVTIETVAVERGLTLRSVRVDSHAVMDIRGFQGVRGARPYYESVQTTVTTDIGLDGQDLPGFADEVERRCPALTLIRAAGVSADVTWEQTS